MDTSISFTPEQLIAMLQEFQEWYEFSWLAEEDIDDKGMSAANYFIWMKRQDPCWPDRPVEVQ